MASKASKYLELLLSKMDDGRGNFMKAIKNKDFETAKKIALELYKKHPGYLFFFCLLKNNENKQMLLNLIRKSESIDPHTVYYIMNSDIFNYEEIKDIVESYNKISFVDICIRKTVFLKKYKTITESDTIRNELEVLLDHLDDFELYDFAIKNNIPIKERDTINYNWYLLCRDCNVEIARKLIFMSTDFEEIKKIISLCGLLKTGNDKYDILIEYITKGYTYSLLERSFEIFKTDKSFISVKILLTLLIASKNENLLVLALYISKNYIQDTNYEVALIHLFLNRYFMIFDQINIMLSKLEIKNIQHHNMAYLWSDPMIISKSILIDNINLFRNEIKIEMDGAETMTRKFIDKNLISHAVSIFSLCNDLSESVIRKEIESMDIFSTHPYTLFSDLLGDGCRYIFDKITINDERLASGMITTIISVASDDFSDSVFENEFLPIEDKDFICEFKKSINKSK